MNSLPSISRDSQRRRTLSTAQALAAGLAETITRAKSNGRLTPAAVTAFAALALADDNGLPIVPAAHHRLWLSLACDERIKKLLIISPPESAKTTWFVSAYLTCRVGFYPESNNIVASVDSSTAEKRSMTVRGLVESSVFRGLFPGVLPAAGMGWERHEWSTAPDGKPSPGRLHPTLRAYGTGQSIVGSRGDLLLADDLIDYNLSRTEGSRLFVREWFHNSFLSRRKSNTGRVIVIGTMWNSADLYADLRRNNEGWVICHTPLLSEAPDGFYADVTYPDDWAYEMVGESCR